MSATYGYTRSQSQAGFSLYNQTYGPAAWLNLSFPIFSGNTLKRNETSARLMLERTTTEQQLVQERLQGEYEQTWALYTTAMEQVSQDEKNVLIAQSHLQLVEERYRLGESTVVDFREAQRSYEETHFRLITNRYLLKLAETDLLRLTGQLVK